MKRYKIAAALLTGLLILSGPAALSGTGLTVTSEAVSKLAAPKKLKAQADGSAVKLTWAKVKGADAYRLYVLEPGASAYRTFADVKGTCAQFDADKPGTYKFRAAALVKTGSRYKAQTKTSAVSAKVTEVNMTDRITVNTQSSIRIDAGSLIIRIDPFRIPDEPHDADIVFITHAHYDHFSPDDIRKVSKSGTVYVCPESMKKQLSDEGFTDAVTLSPGGSTEISDITAEAVRAYNSGKLFHPKSNGWLGYILTVNGQRIYAAGDTDAVKELESISCDIALVPIGGTYTMTYKEAAALINKIKPRTVIPIHYGSIVGSGSDGENFAKLVDKGINVVLKL